MRHYSGRLNGFTLIELMIVVAIMAILVALAVPAYQNYTIRAKVTECITDAAPVKITLSEYRMTTGYWPGSMEIAGIANDPNSNISEYCARFLLNAG